MAWAKYAEAKEFEGKKYHGMRVGGIHRWSYPDGTWKERKTTPSDWEIVFTSHKHRLRRAPKGSGAETGGSDGFVSAFNIPLPPAKLTFDHRGGNEWWVEATISGATPSRVLSRDTDGAWAELTLRSWGAWAGSYHIEPGHDVQFRAEVPGVWYESCWFSHPGGVAGTGGSTCPGAKVA